MAARTNPKHDQATRDKIKTSQLVNRLNAFALSEPGSQGEVVDMSRDQITVALGLLKKTLPDISSVEISGDPDAPVKHEFAWME